MKVPSFVSASPTLILVTIPAALGSDYVSPYPAYTPSPVYSPPGYTPPPAYTPPSQTPPPAYASPPSDYSTSTYTPPPPAYPDHYYHTDHNESAYYPYHHKECWYVSVEYDATYCVDGPVCSGDGEKPYGWHCPKKGDVAVADCHKYLNSYADYDKCTLWADAKCQKVHTGVWGCVVPDCKPVATPCPTTVKPAY
ncbi:TPA: hypothetical protein N0F65_010018 [Lagenidium giganteum]|uniref:Uncharacterized protein n=1 Tax=Lagenidium giganteum TaxID=4803 RepID=A0AAV2ZHF6_9STRA|nr:TPA: hypothetical protein N0F65_010018 [Lagenidium giganteum]